MTIALTVFNWRVSTSISFAGLYTRVPKVKAPQVRDRSWSPAVRHRRRSNSRDRMNRSFVRRRQSRSPPPRGGGRGRGRGGRGGRGGGGSHYWRSRSRSRSPRPRRRSRSPRGYSDDRVQRSPRDAMRSRSPRPAEMTRGTDLELKGWLGQCNVGALGVDILLICDLH